MIKPVGVPPGPGNAAIDASAATKDLDTAQHLLKRGDYSQALPRLMGIINTYPDAAAAVEAHYFLGLAYYQIDGYRDAQLYFSEYLKRAPKGVYAQLSQEYLAGLEDPTARRKAAIERLRESLATSEQSAEASPRELADQLRLADLYWKSAQYEDAGLVYRKLMAQFPELEDDATLRQRMERAPDGAYVLLTPRELDRRYAADNPLYLSDLDDYKSRRFRGAGYGNTTFDDAYHVSGKARNRGEETLHDVQIAVTIYTSGTRVLDTKMISVGRMRAGEVRPFHVRFTNFDNVSNIGRYECTGTFGP
jgi:tetratricopeptide (TPR) repeat protein